MENDWLASVIPFGLAPLVSITFVPVVHVALTDPRSRRRRHWPSTPWVSLRRGFGAMTLGAIYGGSIY